MPDSLTPSDVVSASAEAHGPNSAVNEEPTSPATEPATPAPMSRREMLATWPKTRTAGLLGGRRTPDKALAIRGTASCVTVKVKFGTSAGVYLNKMLMPSMQAYAISLTRSIGYLLSSGYDDSQKVMDLMEEKLAKLRRTLKDETARLTPLLEPYQVELDQVHAHNEQEHSVEWFTPIGRQFINAMLEGDKLFRLIDALHMYSVYNLKRTNLLTNTYIRHFSHFNRSLSDYTGRSRRALDRMREGGNERDLAKIFSLAVATEEDSAEVVEATLDSARSLSESHS